MNLKSVRTESELCATAPLLWQTETKQEIGQHSPQFPYCQWPLSNSKASEITYWYHQACLNSSRAECNTRSSKGGRELIHNFQKYSKTEIQDFTSSCLNVQASAFSQVIAKVKMHSLYSFHTGFSKSGHERPWELFSDREKDHLIGGCIPRTGQEPAAWFPVPSPGVRGNNFWIL